MHCYQYKNLTVHATTIGGVETCYVFPKYGIAMDFGRCPANLIKIDTVFLTHAHLDHSAGLPYYVSQRILRKLKTPNIYVPKSSVKKLKKIIQLWQNLENFSYEINIIPIEPGEKVEIDKNTFVQALPSFHRVETNGYAILEKRVKLKKEYLHFAGKKIKQLKKQKKDIFETKLIPLFSFSGDSVLDFVEKNEIARKSEVLFMECTYIDEKRTIQQSRDWGHTHLDEIIQNKHLFENERLVLVHFSPRYSEKKIKIILKKKIPSEMQSMVDFIPNN